MVSKPPRYLCRGGPLDGLMLNEGYCGHDEGEACDVAGRCSSGSYRLGRDTQGPGLHNYIWQEKPWA